MVFGQTYKKIIKYSYFAEKKSMIRNMEAKFCKKNLFFCRNWFFLYSKWSGVKNTKIFINCNMGAKHQIFKYGCQTPHFIRISTLYLLEVLSMIFFCQNSELLSNILIAWSHILGDNEEKLCKYFHYIFIFGLWY